VNFPSKLEFGRTKPELNGRFAICRQKSEFKRMTSDLSVRKVRILTIIHPGILMIIHPPPGLHVFKFVKRF